MNDKLPPWPKFIAGPTTDAVDALMYQTRRAEAAIARMEELATYARHLRCEYVHHKFKEDYHQFGEPCPVIVRLHDLLAACEREQP